MIPGRDGVLQHEGPGEVVLDTACSSAWRRRLRLQPVDLAEDLLDRRARDLGRHVRDSRPSTRRGERLDSWLAGEYVYPFCSRMFEVMREANEPPSRRSSPSARSQSGLRRVDRPACRGRSSTARRPAGRSGTRPARSSAPAALRTAASPSSSRRTPCGPPPRPPRRRSVRRRRGGSARRRSSCRRNPGSARRCSPGASPPSGRAARTDDRRRAPPRNFSCAIGCGWLFAIDELAEPGRP